MEKRSEAPNSWVPNLFLADGLVYICMTILAVVLVKVLKFL
jgi:hypothetical protein